LHEPEWSPTGPQVVYESRPETKAPQIFLLTERRKAHQLTHLPGGAREPAWSPDGSQIAFVARSRAHRDGRRDTDIYVMKADGSHVRRLAGTPREDDRRPDWSPDGSHVVFDDYGNLWAASVRGREPTCLTCAVPISHRHGPAADPTWSPDGRWIAFTRLDPGSINAMIPYAHLWVMRPNGTDERPITTPKDRWKEWQIEPTWSPDGRSIAFVDVGADRIGVADVRSGDVQLAPTRLPALAAGLHWSRSWLVASVGAWAAPSPAIQGADINQ
jgi:Tol biopolymer transport system component